MQLADYNRKQLRKGQGVDGNAVFRYSEDPYFKSPEAAHNYAVWKSKLPGTDPNKPLDVADFFINGYTHRNIVAKVQGDRVLFEADVPWGGSIFEKTGGRAFGLTDESKDEYRPELLAEAAKIVKQRTGCI